MKKKLFSLHSKKKKNIYILIDNIKQTFLHTFRFWFLYEKKIHSFTLTPIFFHIKYKCKHKNCGTHTHTKINIRIKKITKWKKNCIQLMIIMAKLEEKELKIFLLSFIYRSICFMMIMMIISLQILSTTIVTIENKNEMK